jgi:hypothetical protein
MGTARHRGKHRERSRTRRDVGFIPEAQHSLKDRVNNVELNPFAEAAGAANRRSTQHY